MSNRKRRENLYKQDPHCYWCGILCTVNTSHKQKATDATLDHIHSKLFLKRWLSKEEYSKGKNVLSCYKCNQNRARREDLAMSRSELLNRSVNGYSFKIQNTFESLVDIKNKINNNTAIKNE